MPRRKPFLYAGHRGSAIALALAICGGMVSGACVSGGGASPSPATTPSAVLSAAPTATPAATHGAPSAGGEPKRAVVIDTDMAPDDWLAILFLLGRPEVAVQAITVTGAGEAHCEPGVRHALDLVAMAGQPDIPIACGRDTPLSGTHAFPEEWRDGVDSLLGLSLPRSPNEPARGTAVDLLGTTLRSSVDRVTWLALGPLTNLAEVLKMSPDLAGKIEATYVMGGAVDVDGNVGVSGVGIDNQFAEWNIYVDPTAAKAVLEAGVRVTLVPLDATNDVPVALAFADRLATDSATREAKFASDILTERRDSIAAGFYYFWDPLAAAVLVDENLSSFESSSLTVVAEEGPESGRVIRSAAGPPSRFATSADLSRLEQVLIDAFNGRAGD